MFWEILGLVATLCIIISYVPQIRRSYKTKSMKDFSIVYLCVIAFGVFLWMLYGMHINDAVVTYANVAILGLALSLIAMRIHYSGFR